MKSSKHVEKLFDFLFQTVIDQAHPLFHIAAASNPNMILEKDPVLRPMLENQRAHGK